jgi:hypothetical protein
VDVHWIWIFETGVAGREEVNEDQVRLEEYHDGIGILDFWNKSKRRTFAHSPV